jgi:hypothetical protein
MLSGVTVKLHRSSRLAVMFYWTLDADSIGSARLATESQVNEDGTVHVPAYVLPESPLLGAKAREVLRANRGLEKEASSATRCPSWAGAKSGADARD